MTDSSLSSSSTSEMSKRAEIALLVLGAMLAIPMIHVMLWWFVGADPLGLAQPTSRVIPFIVPNEMINRVELDELEPANPQTATKVETVGSRTEIQMEDGKLPTPNLDPDSVHADDY